MTARLATNPGSACNWCGDVLDGHGRQWHPVAGFHGWEPLRVDDEPSPPIVRTPVVAAIAQAAAGDPGTVDELTVLHRTAQDKRVPDDRRRHAARALLRRLRRTARAQ